MSTHTQPNTYITLDGLRGVAAILVAILHMPRVFDGLALPNAHLAVDLFLQLSGFVIAHAYTQRIANGMTFADFFWRRVNRLYPMFLIGALLGLPVAIASLHNPGSGLSITWTGWGLVCAGLQNGLMLPAMGCGTGVLLFPLNPPMWSVFYELVINLVFFAAVAWKMPRKAYLPLAVAFLLLTILLTLPAIRLDVGYGWHQIGEGAARLTASFLVGVAIFHVHRSNPSQSNWRALFLLLLVLACLTQQAKSYTYQVACMVFVFPLVLLMGVRYNPGSGALVSLCMNLGKLSYPLYVIHKPAYQLVYGAIVKYKPMLVADLGVLLGLVILGLIAALSWYLADTYERVARQFMDDKRRRWLKLKA